MKKYIITSLVLICLLPLALFSCVNLNHGEDLPPQDTTNTDDTSTVIGNTDTPSFDILTDPAIPSEEDIMRVFNHASSIWNRIDIESLDAVGGSEGIILDVTDSSNGAVYRDMQYFPVRDYETKAALEARFRECFSKRLTEHKLEHMFAFQYREIDGRLYVSPGCRGTDADASVSHVEYEVVNDTTVKVTRFINVRRVSITEDYAEMFYLDGVYAQEMMLIYEDGRWVFDNFYVWDNVWGDSYTAYEYAKDIAAAFIDAEKLAAHFTGHASDYLADDSFEVIDENGVTQKYTRYGLADSLSALRALLLEVFTPELTDRFMYTKVSGLPLFTEQDGKLYKFGGYVGLYSYDDVNREIVGYTDNGDGTVSVTVRVWDMYDFEHDVESAYTYTAVLGEDGKYHFGGEFELPIQIAVRIGTNP